MLLRVSHVPIAYAYCICLYKSKNESTPQCITQRACPLNIHPRTSHQLIDKPEIKNRLSHANHRFHLPHPIPNIYNNKSTIVHREKMAFSFGFSGDDIEEDPNDVLEQNQQAQRQSSGMDVDVPPPIAARTHDTDEVVGMRLRFYITHVLSISRLFYSPYFRLLLPILRIVDIQVQ
jgi:hypothetical protein